MTHDERIEACLDALSNYVDDPDGGYPTDYLRKAVIDILAAAGVEEMIREAAEKAWDVGGMSEPMVLRRIVREVMGK